MLRRPNRHLAPLVASCVAVAFLASCLKDAVQVQPGAIPVNVPVTASVEVDPILAAQVNQLRAEVGHLQAQVNIGGGNSEIVAWIAVGGLVLNLLSAGPIGAWWYEKKRRPARIRREGERATRRL